MNSIFLIQLRKNILLLTFLFFSFTQTTYAQQKPYGTFGPAPQSSPAAPYVRIDPQAPAKTVREVHYTFGSGQAKPSSNTSEGDNGGYAPTTPAGITLSPNPGPIPPYIKVIGTVAPVQGVPVSVQVPTPPPSETPSVSTVPEESKQQSNPNVDALKKLTSPSTFRSIGPLPPGAIIIPIPPKKASTGLPRLDIPAKQPRISFPDSAMFGGSPDSQYLPREKAPEDYILPQLWGKLKTWWYPTQPAPIPEPAPKVYTHATWLSDLSAVRTEQEREKVNEEYRLQHVREQQDADIQRIQDYHNNRARVMQPVLVEKPTVAAAPATQAAPGRSWLSWVWPNASPAEKASEIRGSLEAVQPSSWESQFSQAKTEQERDVINAAFCQQKTAELQAADADHAASYKYDPARRRPFTLDGMRMAGVQNMIRQRTYQNIARKSGQKAADELARKDKELDDARDARLLAEWQRDRIQGEQARAQYRYDGADGKVPIRTAEEQAYVASTLADIPENIEEIAKEAAEKVERLKRAHSLYQGPNEPDSPHKEPRKRAAEFMQLFKEVEAKKAADVERRAEWRRKRETEAMLKAHREAGTAKKVFFDLLSIALGARGGQLGGRIQIPPLAATPAGSTIAVGAANPSMGWASMLAARMGWNWGSPSGQKQKPSVSPKDKCGSGGRKLNTINKSEFFENPEIKNNYEYYKEGVYKLKRKGQSLGKAEYLKWDHLHNDVEAWSARGVHLGSVDPSTKTFYKSPQGHKLWS